MLTRTGLSRASPVARGTQDMVLQGLTIELLNGTIAGIPLGVLAQLGNMLAPAMRRGALQPRGLAMLGSHGGLAASHPQASVTGNGHLPGCLAHLTLLLGGGAAAARPLACACSALTLLPDSRRFAAELRPAAHALRCAAALADRERAASLSSSPEMPMLLENDLTCYAALELEANLDRMRVRRVIRQLAELASQAWSLSRKISAARARRARASLRRFW